MAEFNQFFKGHSVSAKDTNGFPSLINVDAHSIAGSATCSRALAKISASLATSAPVMSTKTPNGDTFWANTTDGKIWKESNGTVSLVHTNTNGANFAIEHSKGYVYYASATKLGRIAVANASSEATWSTQTDSWQTFYNTNTRIFKMAEVRGKLLIPNGNILAMVSFLGAFTANALDFFDGFIISTVYPDGNTAVCLADDGTRTAIITWDTLNSSWLWEDYVYEVGGNMFIRLDNEVAMQIGTIGNIYKWTGRMAYLYGRLRNNGNITTSLNPYGSTNLNGLPLISTNQGIYSLGKSDASFPEASLIEYTPSLAGATCYALETRGNDVILGWSNTTTHGIDKTGTGYATAVITTPEASSMEGTVRKIEVDYDKKPGTSTITAKYSKDGGTFTTIALGDSTEYSKMKATSDVRIKKRIQAQITLTPDGSNVPVIDNIRIA